MCTNSIDRTSALSRRDDTLIYRVAVLIDIATSAQLMFSYEYIIKVLHVRIGNHAYKTGLVNSSIERVQALHRPDISPIVNTFASEAEPTC